MPEEIQQPVVDPLLTVQVQIRPSAWDRILELALVEGRKPRRQAGILLEQLTERATVAA